MGSDEIHEDLSIKSHKIQWDLMKEIQWGLMKFMRFYT